MISSPVKWLITIVTRGDGVKIAELCNRCGFLLMYDVYGHGTASSEIMDYLGLDEPEKDVLACLGSSEMIEEVFELMEYEHGLEGHGRGVSFAIPLTSMSVEVANNVMYNKEAEIKNMDSKASVLFFVTEKDMSQSLMEEAKKAGARGGTVIKCRDLRADMKKVFGFTIQPEKEILMLVVPNEQREEIMKAVCAEVYAQTDEHAVAFSMDVSDVRGIRL